MISYVLGLALVLKVKILLQPRPFQKVWFSCWEMKNTHIRTRSYAVCPWSFKKKKKIECILNTYIPVVQQPAMLPFIYTVCSVVIEYKYGKLTIIMCSKWINYISFKQRMPGRFTGNLVDIGVMHWDWNTLGQVFFLQIL